MARDASAMPTKISSMDPGAEKWFQTLVTDLPGVRVRPMFGNVAAFRNGHMFAGVYGRSVFVRLGETDRSSLLAEPGAGRFEPMPGRPMREYVTLPEGWKDHPARARSWARRGFDFVGSLPPKASFPPGNKKAHGSRTSGPQKPRAKRVRTGSRRPS